jgi:hypothetical protein
MADEKYQFCKIFVRAAKVPVVTERLAELLGAQPQRRTFALADAIVDVLKNPDAGLADDFIGWPTIVEVEAEPEASDGSIVALTSRIIESLWDSGWAAVAACDYEAELPWKGGLERLNQSE